MKFKRMEGGQKPGCKGQGVIVIFVIVIIVSPSLTLPPSFFSLLSYFRSYVACSLEVVLMVEIQDKDDGMK